MSVGTPSRPDQRRRPSGLAGGASVLRDVWRRRRRRLLWWSPALLIALAATVLIPLAANYQPLQEGGAGGGSFPGLPFGIGIRWVSKYISNGPELYVPPQRGPFGLAGSVVNRGGFPVTIVGVSQPPGSPFSPAGPARYLTPAEMNRDHEPRHLLRDITLAPGQGIMIGVPLRIEYCAASRRYVGEDVFLVTERFLGFTHTVSVPYVDYNRPVVTNAQGNRRGPAGTFCD